MKYNQKNLQTFCNRYGKSSRSIQMLYKKSAQELKKEPSNIYNIQTLLQQNQDLCIIFQANSQVELEQSRKLQPNDILSSVSFLSQVPLGCLRPFSKWKLSKNKRIEALKDLTILFELVTKLEKKYEDKLSLYSNFHWQYFMV